jgi:lipoprotein-releasing system permease protein
VKIEKWITFFLLSFILLIATFNIIGSLSMLIIEKKDDIRILQSLGATSSFIHKIFLFEGWMISAIGALFGLIFGILICLGQQEYGWLRMGAGYIIDAYPVHLQGSDVLLILITVWILGFIAAFFPARKAKQQPIKP